MSRVLALLVVVAGATRLLGGCGAPPEVGTGTPRRCAKDADCSAQQYCTDAKICRTDCFTDDDCIRAVSSPAGPDQCNAHGRCVGAPVTSPDPETDADPLDAPTPGKDVGPPVSDADDASEGGAA